MPHLLLVFQVHVGYFRVNQNQINHINQLQPRDEINFRVFNGMEMFVILLCYVRSFRFRFIMQLFDYLKNIELVSFTSNLYT